MSPSLHVTTFAPGGRKMPRLKIAEPRPLTTVSGSSGVVVKILKANALMKTTEDIVRILLKDCRQSSPSNLSIATLEAQLVRMKASLALNMLELQQKSCRLPTRMARRFWIQATVQYHRCPSILVNSWGQ